MWGLSADKGKEKVRAQGQVGGLRCCESQPGLGLDPSSATSWLCDLRQISQPLCALDSSSIGVLGKTEWLVAVTLHMAGAVSVVELGNLGPREGNRPFGDTPPCLLQSFLH